LLAGSSHPTHIGHSHIGPLFEAGQYDPHMPPPPVPGPSAINNSTSIISWQSWPSRQNNQQFQPDGPKVFTPGHLAQTLDIPDFFIGKPLRPGYQEAHKMYDKMWNHFAWQAFASNNFELVAVKVTMMWLKPGKKNPSIVSMSCTTRALLHYTKIFLTTQNILKMINNVHIGVHDLKIIAFLTLCPLFLKWSKDYFISIDEVCLHSKDWVEMVLIIGAPDVDTIVRKFFVAKGKARSVQFHAGKGIKVFLELEHEKYQQIIIHLEELVDNTLESLVCPTT
jgi:hypothetical protein